MQDLPLTLMENIPLVQGHKFVKFDDRIVVVEPASRTVVALIPRYRRDRATSLPSITLWLPGQAHEMGRVAHRATADGGGASGEAITAGPVAGGATAAAGAGGVAAAVGGGLPASTTTRVPTFTRE